MTSLSVAAPPRQRAKPASFRNVAAFLATLLAGYLVCEILIFRSGFYARYLEPEYSGAGNLERTFYTESHRLIRAPKEVLVIGNSRIAEGFSAQLANQQTPRRDYRFVNFSVPGTGDRVWYYLVRDIDPHRNRYAAIAIPIDDYNDPDDYEDVADRVSEMPMLINRLRATDIVPYTMSFTKWTSRFEVFRGLVFKGVTYQHDFQDFMEHPARRLERVNGIRALGTDYGWDYEGIHESMAGFKVNWSNQTIEFPPDMPAGRRHDLTSMFFSEPPQKGMNRAFEMRWLGALIDLYRGTKTRIVIFQAPRSPSPRPVPLSHWSWTFVDEMRKRPGVIVIDPQAFDEFEKAELFADHVHLNSEGRKVFSPRFAAVVRQALR